MGPANRRFPSPPFSLWGRGPATPAEIAQRAYGDSIRAAIKMPRTASDTALAWAYALGHDDGSQSGMVNGFVVGHIIGSSR